MGAPLSPRGILPARMFICRDGIDFGIDSPASRSVRTLMKSSRDVPPPTRTSSDMFRTGKSWFPSKDYSNAPPAFLQAPTPPDRFTTGCNPMSIATTTASADRAPEAQ